MYWSGKRAHKNFKIVWKLFAEGLPGHFGFCRHRRWETVNTQCWSFACRSFSSLKRHTRLIRYCYFFFSRDAVGGHGSKTCQRYQPKGPLCLSLSPLFTVNLLKLVLKSNFLLWMHSQKKNVRNPARTSMRAHTPASVSVIQWQEVVPPPEGATFGQLSTVLRSQISSVGKSCFFCVVLLFLCQKNDPIVWNNGVCPSGAPQLYKKWETSRNIYVFGFEVMGGGGVAVALIK